MEEFDRLSNQPLYTAGVAARAAGIPAMTLRSWERRYGIPDPQRDQRGHRLYSERDIALAIWLRNRVRSGVGVGHAVAVLRERIAGGTPERWLEHDIVTLAGQQPAFEYLSLRTGYLDVGSEALVVAVNGSREGLFGTLETTLDEALRRLAVEHWQLVAIDSSLPSNAGAIYIFQRFIPSSRFAHPAIQQLESI